MLNPGWRRWHKGRSPFKRRLCWALVQRHWELEWQRGHNERDREGGRGNLDSGDRMGRWGGWPKTGQEELMDKWRGRKMMACTQSFHRHKHARTHARPLLYLTRRMNHSNVCLCPLPDCEAASVVLSPACVFLCPVFFSRLSFSQQTHTTVIFLAPAPLATVESKASALYHYLYRLSHYCPLQCPNHPNAALRSRGGGKRAAENKLLEEE